MEDLKQRTGIDMQHVPYRGAAPALNGILGNEVSVMLLNLSSVEEHAAAGKVRLIAAATEKRVPTLANLPTIAETVPNFQTSVWFGPWGPAKIPPALLAKIHADVSKALDLLKRGNSSKPTASSASISRPRISASSFKAI